MQTTSQPHQTQANAEPVREPVVDESVQRGVAFIGDPGLEAEMEPPPVAVREAAGSGKLRGRVAIVTGGDSGIGRAVSLAYAKEGASVAIVYLCEHADAMGTASMIRALGQDCLLLAGDVGDPEFCQMVVAQVTQRFGDIHILVNNAGEQHPQQEIADIDPGQLERTFRTNVFGMFHLTRYALPHMRPGSAIINTASVAAYRGSPQLLDYAASKGAVVAFTRSLSLQLVEQGIRVNAVAPGPVWTPLVASNRDSAPLQQFGQEVPMHRAAQPAEIAPAYVFLASEDASYMSGQVLHPNGGEVING